MAAELRRKSKLGEARRGEGRETQPTTEHEARTGNEQPREKGELRQVGDS